MKTTAIPDARLTLGALLRRPYERMAERIYAELPARGFPELRQSHSVVLRNLPAQGASVAELARAAGMTKQSMAYLVDALARAGYVELAADPHDGRAKRVCFSARGEAAVAELVALSAEYEQRVEALLGAERAGQLRSLLETLYTRLDEDDLGAAGNP